MRTGQLSPISVRKMRGQVHMDFNTQIVPFMGTSFCLCYI